MAKVLLEKVTKVFDGGVVAVNDMDIDVKDKEFMVIVGPSGCGKTTILRVIAGLEEPTAGTITIGEDVVNDVAPKNRDVAMVFQNYALYPHMTVYQNMAFSLKVRRTPKAKIRAAVEETAKMLGIEGLLNRKPKALSGGQRQRVAVGRAIVRNPKVFLFDEPLSNLDAKFRVTTRGELKALHQRLQTTCIYVTHDQTEAMTLGDRICVMNRGIVQQIARPMDVYDRPINRFVAGFLGTPPMNFLDGVIEIKDSRASFAVGSSCILLADDMVDKVRAHNGRSVVLGVRAENLSLEALGGREENVFGCKVRVVEPLGDRMDVILETAAGLGLTISVDAHTAIKAGDTVQVYIDTGKVHLFEPGETGKSLLYPPSGLLGAGAKREAL